MRMAAGLLVLISVWSLWKAGGNAAAASIIPIQQPGGGNSSSYNDVFVGYLEPLRAGNDDYPFAGGTHFMIVNGASTGTAVGQAQWYHLAFDFGASGFDSLQKLSRDTGRIEFVPLTHLTGSQYSVD
jgi:hypothetical protein